MKKKKMIEEIKLVIGTWGETSSFELELDSSPCVNSIGNGKNNVAQLAEYFKHDGVGTITYHDDIEIGADFILYEDLEKPVIKEIYNIMVKYNTKMEEEE